jgi:alpha-tubulin suppressor-like RCC1 family protein
LTGFDLEDPEVLQSARAAVAKILGRSHFVANLDTDGYLVDIANGDRRSKDAYYDATIDGHGRVLVISKDDTLRFSKTLSDAIEGVSEPVSLDHELSPTSRLYSGAAHFLIHASPDILYSLGADNRFFQLGHDNRNAIATRAEQLGMFEGGSPIRRIACGDLHSAVVTEDGALYVFGSDAQGQCGAFSDSEPSLVEFQVVEGMEQPDVLDVACGSRHTVVLTDQGIYATGSSAFAGTFPLPPADLSNQIT